MKTGGRVGPYTVVEALEHRGATTRYLARRVGAPGFSRAIALTVIEPPSMLNRSRILQAIHEGTKPAAGIEDPRLARVEDVGEDGERIYVAEEHVGGRSVAELLDAVEGRALPVELATHLALEAALALHAAHEALDARGRPLRIVHRGVSPITLQVTWRGHVKVTGLGLAQTMADPNGVLDDDGAVYRPPEHRAASLDGRGDVYGLALVLWEMLAGVRPPMRPHGEPLAAPSGRRSDVPRELDEAILAGAQPHAEDRPPTALAFHHMLADALPAGIGLTSFDVARTLALLRAEQGLPPVLSADGLSKPPPPVLSTRPVTILMPHAREAITEDARAVGEMVLRIPAAPIPRLEEGHAPTEDGPTPAHAASPVAPANAASPVAPATDEAPLPEPERDGRVDRAAASAEEGDADSPARGAGAESEPPREPARREALPWIAILVAACGGGLLALGLRAAIAGAGHVDVPLDASTPSSQPAWVPTQPLDVDGGPQDAGHDATPAWLAWEAGTAARDAGDDASADAGVTPRERRRDPEEARATFGRASRLAMTGSPGAARSILEPHLRHGTISAEEATLLEAICKSQRDDECLGTLARVRGDRDGG